MRDWVKGSDLVRLYDDADAVIGTAGRGITPPEYLTDLLRRFLSLRVDQIDRLLPEPWSPPPCQTG